MKTKKLCLTVAFVIVVVLAITLFACGNEGGGKNNTDELLPTLIKVRILPQSYEFNGDEEHDVCLSLLGRTIEKFTIELVLNNPDNHEIISFKYNGKEYDSNDFDSSSTNKSVIIKNLSVEPTVKEFEVKITDIVYYYKGARQKMANLTNNVKNVKVNPTFKLTLDLSETNEGPGATLEIEHQYCQELDVINEYAMNEYQVNDWSLGYLMGVLNGDSKLYGKEGYVFDGWYTAPNGKGKKIGFDELYTYYSDVTLYAHYGQPLDFKITETEAIVIGLTDVGKTTQFPIIVPENFEGKPVKRIANNAFISVGAGKKYLLPDSLVEIGDYAFHRCTGITVEMNRVERIGKFAFAECGKITLGRGKGLFKNPSTLPVTLREVGEYAFKGCSWDTAVPNPLVSEDALFSSYFGEEDVLVIPSNLAYLGDYAFTESLFKGVYFQKNSALNGGYLGKSVFNGSRQLSSICTSFEFTTDRNVINQYAVGGLEKITEKMFYNCTALSCEESSMQIKLNEGLKEIGDLAFASSDTGTTKFNYLKLPDSLLDIGTQAFANSGLRRVDFSPNSKLQTLGKWCFENSEFESINIYSCITYEESPFWGNTAIKAINILTNNVPTYKVPTTIGLTRKAKYYVKKEMLAAFRAKNSSWNKESTILDDYIYIAAENILCYDFIATSDEGLELCFEPVNDDGSLDTTFTSNNVRVTSVMSTDTHIEVPTHFPHGGTYKTVVGIGKFFIHQDVKKVALPWTIKRIEDSAFYACNYLSEVIWKKDSIEYVKDSAAGIALTHIGKRAFYATDITYFFANDALTTIGGEAFMLCDQLKKVVIDRGIDVSIGVSAFSQCGIELLVLGTEVKYIGRSAFQNNNDLKYVLMEHSEVPYADATETYYPDISPFNSCGGLVAFYLFSNNAVRNFDEKKFSNNEVNTYSGLKKADGLTSAFEKYSNGFGTWTEALEEFNVRETE